MAQTPEILLSTGCETSICTRQKLKLGHDLRGFFGLSHHTILFKFPAVVFCNVYLPIFIDLDVVEMLKPVMEFRRVDRNGASANRIAVQLSFSMEIVAFAALHFSRFPDPVKRPTWKKCTSSNYEGELFLMEKIDIMEMETESVIRGNEVGIGDCGSRVKSRGDVHMEEGIEDIVVSVSTLSSASEGRKFSSVRNPAPTATAVDSCPAAMDLVIKDPIIKKRKSSRPKGSRHKTLVETDYKKTNKNRKPSPEHVGNGVEEDATNGVEEEDPGNGVEEKDAGNVVEEDDAGNGVEQDAGVEDEEMVLQDLVFRRM
uniref:Uncharacterized protein n=1 Tax=Chenopodium quinoa TaxID=63459 RepID=A0A803MVE2_CHEQI